MFKCPLCGNAYKEIEDLYLHIEEVHSELIPEDYTPARYLYQLKTGKTHGSCVMCKKPTGWNERTNKYHRFCDNPKCKEQYREIFKERMIGKHGKVTLLDDPEHQKKMLANRRISGTYNMNGKEIGYTGTYELDFLKMLDMVLDWDENDIISPSPHTYWYEYDGRRHFYIPDFYIPSLNLEVEIKDGGDNPNNHWKIQAVDKEKERLKDEVMKTGTTSYIKVVNKQYGGFFTLLNKAKQNFANGMKERPIILLESVELTKEKVSLSNFRKIPVTDTNVSKYKEKYSGLKHLRTGDNIKGYIFIDSSDNVVAYYAIDIHRNYIIAIEVAEKYRRNGLAKEILKLAGSQGAKQLSVNKNNKAAISLYQNNGFRVSDQDDIMLYMTHECVMESMGDVLCKCKNCGSLIGFSEDNREKRCYDCGHDYRTGGILPTSNYKEIYHISTSNMDGVVLSPRIPNNYFTENGFEDRKTPRVCFSTSIDGSLTALSQNIEGQEFYVHVPACRQKIYAPKENEVPDVKLTDEVWVSTPTRIRCIGKIKVSGATGQDMMFKYGDNTGYNVRWDWRWVEKKNDFTMESTQNRDDYLHPIYILLTYTDSTMAKAIKLVTKQPYSHAGISLDSSLSHIFTYGRKNAEDRCQFTDENIFNGLLGENRDTVQYALYVTFFNTRQLKVLTQHIENIKNDITKHKYSYKGLINFALGKETHDDRMFCSQFVASVIKAGDPNRLKRDISLYSPTDLREVSGMYFVTRGILGNYNKAKVDDIVKKIKDRISLGSSNIMFESIMPVLNEELLSNQHNIVDFANIVNECTDVDALAGTLSYLDNDFCKPIIENRLRNITTESTMVKYGSLQPSQEGFRDENGIWNSVVSKKGKVYRERCETLIIRNGKVFLYIKPNGGYAIPGGSTEPDKTIVSQLENECREEARINIKNSVYVGSYYKLYEKTPKWMENLPVKYDGLLTHLFVSKYDSMYNGDIDEHDIDKKMIDNGRFYNINEVSDILSKQHREALSKSLVTESSTLGAESNMYILLETTQNRFVNGKVIAFNPSDKETKLYTVTVENVDNRRDFHVNKYGKIGTSLVLEDTDIDIPDDNDKVYIGFDVKTPTSNIQSIIESITEARLSPTAHAGIILDLNNDKLLTDYMTSMLESIGIQGMEIHRFK